MTLNTLYNSIKEVSFLTFLTFSWWQLFFRIPNDLFLTSIDFQKVLFGSFWQYSRVDDIFSGTVFSLFSTFFTLLILPWFTLYCLLLFSFQLSFLLLYEILLELSIRSGMGPLRWTRALGKVLFGSTVMLFGFEMDHLALGWSGGGRWLLAVFAPQPPPPFCLLHLPRRLLLQPTQDYLLCLDQILQLQLPLLILLELMQLPYELLLGLSKLLNRPVQLGLDLGSLVMRFILSKRIFSSGISITLITLLALTETRLFSGGFGRISMRYVISRVLILS